MCWAVSDNIVWLSARVRVNATATEVASGSGVRVRGDIFLPRLRGRTGAVTARAQVFYRTFI